MAKNKNKVIIKRTFKNITGSVFERKVENKVFYSFVVQKFYKTDDDEWEYTTSFDEKEALIVAEMYKYLFIKLQEHKNED